MKKIVLLVLCLAGCIVHAVGEEEKLGPRIDFSVDNAYISHPYYLSADSAQENLSQNVTLKFTAAKKNRSWAYLAVRIPELQWDNSYSGVKIVYKAVLPPGLQMSFVVEESEVAYEFKWTPEKTGEWCTVVISFAKMLPSTWNRKADSNNQLDVNLIRTVLLGVTGQTPPGATELQGRIEVDNVHLLRK